MPIIQVEGLKKVFGDLEVLHDINLEIKENETVAIIGPSGSGKSTLLRSLINLETVTEGNILINENYLVRDGKYGNRNDTRKITSMMGMVFQNFHLFPHLTVRGNLELAPRQITDTNRVDIRKRSLELLEQVGLGDKADVYPSRLSGGQKQRVAIARALMLCPKILLFDEPTSALDPELTSEVLKVIRELASQHRTMIIVTHEMEFAMEVSNKVIFMDKGEVIEVAPPKELFSNPTHPRTQAFLNR